MLKRGELKLVRRSLKDRRRKNINPDPVYGNRRVRTERRRAKGPLLPTLYLLLEAIMILLLIYTFYELGVAWLFYLAMAAGTYYFLFSCIPRYRIVLRRQKLYGPGRDRSMASS